MEHYEISFYQIHRPSLPTLEGLWLNTRGPACSYLKKDLYMDLCTQLQRVLEPILQMFDEGETRGLIPAYKAPKLSDIEHWLLNTGKVMGDSKSSPLNLYIDKQFAQSAS